MANVGSRLVRVLLQLLQSLSLHLRSGVFSFDSLTGGFTTPGFILSLLVTLGSVRTPCINHIYSYSLRVPLPSQPPPRNATARCRRASMDRPPPRPQWPLCNSANQLAAVVGTNRPHRCCPSKCADKYHGAHAETCCGAVAAAAHASPTLLQHHPSAFFALPTPPPHHHPPETRPFAFIGRFVLTENTKINKNQHTDTKQERM